jgi:hypothetical protein
LGTYRCSDGSGWYTYRASGNMQGNTTAVPPCQLEHASWRNLTMSDSVCLLCADHSKCLVTNPWRLAQAGMSLHTLLLTALLHAPQSISTYMPTYTVPRYHHRYSDSHWVVGGRHAVTLPIIFKSSLECPQSRCGNIPSCKLRHKKCSFVPH